MQNNRLEYLEIHPYSSQVPNVANSSVQVTHTDKSLIKTAPLFHPTPVTQQTV